MIPLSCRNHRTAWLRLGGVLLLALLLTAACGTRRSHDEIVAAAATDQSGEAFDFAPQAGRDDGGPAGSTTTTVESTSPSPSSSERSEAPEASAGGPSGPSGTTSPTTSDDQATSPCPDGAQSPVKVGHIGSYAGIVGAVLAGGREAAQVWARSVNSRGGLACHPVELLTANDEGDPARNASIARQMVQDGVIAFVGNQTPLSASGAVDHLTQQHVPAVGGDLVHPAWHSTPILFPQGTEATRAATGAVIEAMRVAGSSDIALWYCGEATACTQSNDAIKRNAEEIGANIVYNPQISLGQQNFTIECRESNDRGAEVVMVAADGSALARAADSCASQNYRPQFATVSLALVNSLADTDSLDGMLATSQVFPWSAADTDATREFAEAMARYAPDVELSGAAAYVWTSGKLLEAATGDLGADPTSQDVLDGLYALSDETLDGLAPPLSFRQDQAAPAPRCYFLVQLDGGRFVAPQGSQLICP